MSRCTCHSHSGFLTAAGYAAVAQRDILGPELAGVVAKRYLDKVGSVSALAEAEDSWMCDTLIDEQYQRFLHGS